MPFFFPDLEEDHKQQNRTLEREREDFVKEVLFFLFRSKRRYHKEKSNPRERRGLCKRKFCSFFVEEDIFVILYEYSKKHVNNHGNRNPQRASKTEEKKANSFSSRSEKIRTSQIETLARERNDFGNKVSIFSVDYTDKHTYRDIQL